MRAGDEEVVCLNDQLHLVGFPLRHDPYEIRDLRQAAGDGWPGRCIFPGCVSRDRHWHGGFPGGYDNPDDPDGPPIAFTREPKSGVRDYNGALLAEPSAGPLTAKLRRVP